MIIGTFFIGIFLVIIGTYYSRDARLKTYKEGYTKINQIEYLSGIIVAIIGFAVLISGIK